MATLYPDLENIKRLKVKPEEGELYLIEKLVAKLDDTYEIFFNPYLDGDRPDIIIIKPDFAVFVIEVKDWSLEHYFVSYKNEWFVKRNNKKSQIKSPQAQAFRYKANLYNLHLPVLGLKSIGNKGFYNIIKPFVYLHKSTGDLIKDYYQSALDHLRQLKTDNNTQYRNKEITYDKHDKNADFYSRKESDLYRDRKMLYGRDRIEQLIKEITLHSNRSNVFSDEIYRDFHRRLSPPEHTLRQGIRIDFDPKQKKIANSTEKREKVKGVAGCGKTSILAQRAINAYERSQSTVLILAFNITLRNYISDRISDLQGFRRFGEKFEISNYHQFFNSQANNIGFEIGALLVKDSSLPIKAQLESIYKTDIFKGKDTYKYQTILIDEIQDFDPEWIKIIRENFLVEDGEMALFGDESQDIYNRNSSKAPVIAQGFGRWKTLMRSYRTSFDSPLNQLFKDFQLQFLIDRHEDTEVFETSPTQTGLEFDLLEYEPVSASDWKKTIFESIQGIIKAYDLHPNDVVILASRIDIVRSLNEYWLEIEKTQAMFETFSEIEANTPFTETELKKLTSAQLADALEKHQDTLEKIRRVKKTHFYSNSGLIKISTIQSFKGFESKMVFCIALPEDEAEITYTSITRSTKHLMIFGLDMNKNKYELFFKDNIKSTR